MTKRHSAGAMRAMRRITPGETLKAHEWAAAIISEETGDLALIEALERAQELCERALPQFNWGASALSADSIALLNEVPGEIKRALAAARKEG